MNQPAQPGGAAHQPPFAPPASGGTSGLAITAFVLACLFFVPFMPLIGAILGIVALVRMGPEQGGRGLAIAAIPVGLVMVIFLQGMLAAIAIPSFIRYTRKAKSVEASESLDKLRAGARSFVRAERYDETGKLQPPQFPPAITGWVPQTPCCQQQQRGHRCLPRTDDWQGEPWRALQFQLADPHYYQYRYRSDGRTVEIEARGDLDCDGTYSSYKILGELGADGAPTFRGPIVTNETE